MTDEAKGLRYFDRWQREGAVGVRREIHDVDDGIQVQRAVDVRKGLAGFVAILVADFGGDLCLIDAEQDEARARFEARVGNGHDLRRERAVDEAFGFQRVATIDAQHLCPLPRRAGSNVQNDVHRVDAILEGGFVDLVCSDTRSDLVPSRRGKARS